MPSWIRVPKILYTARFWEMFKTLLEEGCITEDQVKQRIYRFTQNPQDTRLVNHELRKHLLGRWSFSINSDIRIVYRWLGKNLVQFLKIGGHKQVYS